jgi:hypothetical protein
MQNVQDLQRELLVIQEAVAREYTEDHALCHILHRELGLGTTKPEPEVLEEALDRIRETTGEEPDEDALDLTVEHHDLHILLRTIKLEAAMAGIGIDQMMSSLLILGRRLGLREAAAMMGITDDEASDGPVAE